LPRPSASYLFAFGRSDRRPSRSQNPLRRHPDSLSLDGVVSRRDGLPWNDSRLACASHFGADRLFRFLRATRAPVDPAPAGTPAGATKRCHPLSDGLQWIDALRTVDWRSADCLHRYQRLLFRRDNWKLNRASYDLYDSHRRNSTTDKQNHRVPRYGRGVGFGMEYPDFSILIYRTRNRHFLYQAVHSIHAGFCTGYPSSRCARPRPVAHGTGSRRDSRRSHARIYSPLPETAFPAFFSRGRFRFLHLSSSPLRVIFCFHSFFYFSPAVFRPLSFPPLRPCCKSKALKPTAAE